MNLKIKNIADKDSTNIKDLPFHEQYNYLNKFINHDISNSSKHNVSQNDKLIFSKAKSSVRQARPMMTFTSTY